MNLQVLAFQLLLSQQSVSFTVLYVHVNFDFQHICIRFLNIIRKILRVSAAKRERGLRVPL